MRPSTRDTLIQSAITTLAAQPGASLEDIAQRAGVGRATLHRHFGSRDGLIHALTREAIAATDRAMVDISRDTSATEILRAVIEAIVPLGDQYHFLTLEAATKTDPEITAEIDRQLREMSELVAAVKQEGTIATDVPDAWVVAALDALIYAAWTSAHEGWIARRDAPGLVFRTIIGGLSASDAG
ncbi:MAG: TetR/AcrR family transcriptional regulator [Acidobacteriota bacterium]